MPEQPIPYIGRCSFCGDGLLRFARCRHCQEIVAICDECELIWRDVAEWKKDPELTSDGAHPYCPVCEHDDTQWVFLSQEELRQAGLEPFCEGESV